MKIDYDVNDNLVHIHEKEYDNFDFESYCRGWTDGGYAAEHATIRNLATVIYAQWDEFIDFLESLPYPDKYNGVDFTSSIVNWIKKELDIED